MPITLALYLEINVVGIVLLSMMYYNLVYKQPKTVLYDQTLFVRIVVFTIAIIIADTGMWLFDGATFPLAKAANHFSTLVYFFLHPVIFSQWMLYCDYKLFEDKTRLRRLAVPYAIPAFLSFIFIVPSIFTGWVYRIDDTNRYSRGKFFFLILLVAACYFSYTALLVWSVWRHDKNPVNRSTYVSLILFPFLPFCGGLLQFFFFGLSLIWICVTISLLFIFINVQNRLIFTDALTGLYNRRHFERQLAWRIKDVELADTLFLILVDVDHFKSVNDTYGHSEGDAALVEVAQLLRACCTQRQDLAARLGGDEFVLCGQRSNAQEVNAVVQNIRRHLKESNASGRRAYPLFLSIGTAFCQTDNAKTMDDLFHMADQRMYRQKTHHYYSPSRP